MFNEVPQNVSFPALEIDVLEFWKQQRIYEKSLEQRQGADEFVFYEGPPTANGMPHPGHCLTRAIKDLFPRYRTMRGYRCERKAGWDTHGLPVEVEVCKELGIHSKEEIEDLRRRTVHPEVPAKRLALHAGVGAADRATRFLGPSGRSLRHLPPKLRRKRLVVAEEPVRPRPAVPRTQDRLVVGPRRHGAVSRRSRPRLPRSRRSQCLRAVSRWWTTRTTSLLVWTTTPWTLPSNQFAAVHPELEYCDGRSMRKPANEADRGGGAGRDDRRESSNANLTVEVDVPGQRAGRPAVRAAVRLLLQDRRRHDRDSWTTAERSTLPGASSRPIS